MELSSRAMTIGGILFGILAALVAAKAAGAEGTEQIPALAWLLVGAVVTGAGPIFGITSQGTRLGGKRKGPGGIAITGLVAGMSVMLLSGCALLQSPDAAGVSRLDHEKVAYTAQVAATAGLQALTSAGRLGEITKAEAKPVADQLYYAGTKAGEAVEIATRIADEPEAEGQFWAALQESQRVLGLVAQNPAVSSLGIFPTSQ